MPLTSHIQRQNIKRRIVPILLWLLLITVLSTGLVRAQETEQTALERLMSSIPDRPQDYTSPVIFNDLSAWFESWNIPRVLASHEIESLSERDKGYMLYVLPRQLGYFSSWAFYDSGTQTMLGFDELNLDRHMIIGTGEDGAFFAEFSFDKREIGNRLYHTGFEAKPLDDETNYYNLFDTVFLLITDKTVAFTFGFTAVSDIRYTEMGQQPSLGDNPIFASVVSALKDPELEGIGDLISLVFLHKETPHVSTARDVISRLPREDEYLEYFETYPLPPYSLAAFGTSHADGATYLTAMIVLEEGEDADKAAETLYSRLENYRSFERRKLFPSVLADHDAQLDYAVGIETGVLPVAVVVIRSEDPPAEFVPGKTYLLPTEGRIPFNWRDAVESYDLGFLAN